MPKLRELLNRFVWRPGDVQIEKPTPAKPRMPKDRSQAVRKGTGHKALRTCEGMDEGQTPAPVKEKPKTKKPVTYRMARVPDAKDPTKLKWVACNKRGTFTANDRKFWGIGVDRVDEYVTVIAVGLKEAREKVERGEGERVQVSQGGEQ